MCKAPAVELKGLKTLMRFCDIDLRGAESAIALPIDLAKKSKFER
jgi:hypothetical protein